MNGNLPNLVNGAIAINAKDPKLNKQFSLFSDSEIQVAIEFSNHLVDSVGKSIPNLNECYYVLSYFNSNVYIRSIDREFDLLRYGTNYSVNIELKFKLTDKALSQASIHQFYFNSVNLDLFCYVYVYQDGLYKLISDELVKVDFDVLVKDLLMQSVDESFSIPEHFNAKNFIISPINNYDRFINGKYFLTPNQEKIMNQIFEFLNNDSGVFCLHGGPGSGKSLMLYSLAMHLETNGFNNYSITHCAGLSSKHYILAEKSNLKLIHIKGINRSYFESKELNKSILIIDESQRIYPEQLDLLMEKISDGNLCLVCGYDPNQWLRKGENKEIYKIFSKKFKKREDIVIRKADLKTKLRSDPIIYSFVYKLFKIGDKPINIDANSYESNLFSNNCPITIEFSPFPAQVNDYADYLKNKESWEVLKPTTLRYYEGYSKAKMLCEINGINVHDAIGQEFDKVAVVFDNTFFYDKDKECLCTNASFYYDGIRQYYQMMTRSVSKLKIVVLENIELYNSLLEILKSTITESSLD